MLKSMRLLSLLRTTTVKIAEGISRNTSINNQQRISSRFLSKRAAKCWRCGTERTNAANLFCDKCKAVQAPAHTNNYFQVFDLNGGYDVDVKALQQKYRRMQSLLHPDKFSNKSSEERTISADYSSLVNKAYNTLQSPLSRALHILRLNDQTIGEDDKASDPAFLIQIMELNEEVDEAVSPDQLKELNMKNNEMLNSLGKEVSKHFEASNISSAKQVVIKMKYYASLSARINDLLREKGWTE